MESWKSDLEMRGQWRELKIDTVLITVAIVVCTDLSISVKQKIKYYFSVYYIVNNFASERMFHASFEYAPHSFGCGESYMNIWSCRIPYDPLISNCITAIHITCYSRRSSWQWAEVRSVCRQECRPEHCFPLEGNSLTAGPPQSKLLLSYSWLSSTFPAIN